MKNKPTIKFRIYRPAEDNPSHLVFVGKGDCFAYIPTIRNDKKTGFKLDRHVTLDLGDLQLMLDMEGFKQFAKEVLDMEYSGSRVTKLKLVKG